jgi:hypothetical protein
VGGWDYFVKQASISPVVAVKNPGGLYSCSTTKLDWIFNNATSWPIGLSDQVVELPVDLKQVMTDWLRFEENEGHAKAIEKGVVVVIFNLPEFLRLPPPSTPTYHGSNYPFIYRLVHKHEEGFFCAPEVVVVSSFNPANKLVHEMLLNRHFNSK